MGTVNDTLSAPVPSHAYKCRFASLAFPDGSQGAGELLPVHRSKELDIVDKKAAAVEVQPVVPLTVATRTVYATEPGETDAP